MIFAKIIFFISLKLTLIDYTYCKTQWIDPHSLDDDPTIMQECDCPNIQTTSLTTSHFIRTISIILNSLKLDKVEHIYKGNYEVRLTKEEYIYMKTFLHSTMDDPKEWDKMDKIITTIFQNVGNTYFMEMISWKDYIVSIVSSKEFAIGAGILSILWFLHKARHAKLTFLNLVSYFLFFLYVVDLIYTWILLLKEKELEQLLHVSYTVPPECDVKKMGWSQYFGYLSHTFMGKDKCREYHKIKDIDIFWSVSPSQVIGTQFGNMILAPAEKIGNAFGKLTSGVLGQSSWFTMIPTLLMIPLFLMMLLLFGCIFLSFITGRGFSFSFFHLFSFSFGKTDEDRPVQNETKPLQSQPLYIVSKRKRLRLKEEKKTSTKTLESIAAKPEIEEFHEDEQNEEEDSENFEKDGEEASPKSTEFNETEYEIIG